MQRPLLLVPDGESLRTPELERVFADGGWDTDWGLKADQVESRVAQGTSALVLVDPQGVKAEGVQILGAMRNRRPDLPVVVLVEGASAGPLPVAGAETLQRTTPVIHWPGILHGFLPRGQAGQKLTSEDIFGDILAEIEGPPAAAPVAVAPVGVAPVPAPAPPATVPLPPPAPVPVVTPTPAPVAPKPTLVQVPISRPTVTPGVPHRPSAPTVTTIQAQPVRPPVIKTVPVKTERAKDVSTAPMPIPSFAAKTAKPVAPTVPLDPPTHPTGAVSAPTAPSAPDIPAPVLPELFGDLLGPLAEPAPSSKGDLPKLGSDFTLSGLSGIHDIFSGGQKEAPSPAKAPVAPTPEPKKAEPLEPESLEFLDVTPASRPDAKPAASLVVQPPPRPLPVDEPVVSGGEPPLEEFGNYYLLEKIAVGGMAELFKARQRGVHNFEKIVAIKRILPHLSDNDEFVRMFIDEAKLAAQLTHPNIVQIFDLGKASGFYYIAMEYVDGKDLRSMLRKVREYRRPLPEPIAAYVTMKVAMALDYAHRKRGMNDKELKLVHRDVSPQNVLIGSEGAVKLVDFGIAKAATKSTQTMAGALKGKLLYMSPEQALGQSLDNRSDIYSLGLVLFELLTGERCFQADSELGVLEKVRLGKVQDVRMVNPAVSQGMAQILEKALQKNVDQRYHSARLMERDLKALLVQTRTEPTEHDLAEYVNTLLKGTKDQLELLLAERFAPRESSTPLASPAPLPAPTKAKEKLDDLPTMAGGRKPASVSLPVPPPELMDAQPKSRPWLVPAILGGLALIGGVIWLLVR